MFDDKCSFCTYIVLEMFGNVLYSFASIASPNQLYFLLSCPSSSIGGPVTDWLNDSFADGL